MKSTRTARDYMANDVVVLKPDTELHRAMRVLLDNNISGAPVVDGQGNLVGLLTEKDCFKAAFEASYHKELTGAVSQYMSTPVETIDAETDIVEVVEHFLRDRYRRFPVVADGRLVGQISRRDVLRALEDLW